MRGMTRARLKLRLHRLAGRVDERLPHGRRSIRYHGYDVVYSRGNSLVERIKTQGEYEPRVCQAIVHALEESETRTFVDIGANIGLVSLAVLAGVPDASVFAFEPGPHQHALLAETIRLNRLEDRLSLYPWALADKSGTATFAVHSTVHAAGDGLIDTGRSGTARYVPVRTETLDHWWHDHARPPIAVAKIDVEGAELLTLRGADSVIRHCRPTIVLEISEDNLRLYPYGPEDVGAHLEGLGYELEEIGKGDFVARPR